MVGTKMVKMVEREMVLVGFRCSECHKFFEWGVLRSIIYAERGNAYYCKNCIGKCVGKVKVKK